MRPSGALALAVLSQAGQVFAQGCVSCYTTAAAGGLQTAHALRVGILLLLVPPVMIFASIIFTLPRWRSHTPCSLVRRPADSMLDIVEEENTRRKSEQEGHKIKT